MYFPLEFLDFSPRDVVSKLPLEPSFLAPIPAVSVLLFECSWIHSVCYVRVVGVAGTIHHVADVAALSRSDRGPILYFFSSNSRMRTPRSSHSGRRPFLSCDDSGRQSDIHVYLVVTYTAEPSTVPETILLLHSIH
jgi:hypothetical protein